MLKRAAHPAIKLPEPPQKPHERVHPLLLPGCLGSLPDALRMVVPFLFHSHAEVRMR